MELCAGSYIAKHIAGHVVIFAIGVHHVTGFSVFFKREQGDVFPPRFSLWHVQSEQPELHVLTPFAVTAFFQTTRDVTQVEVLDAHGPRTIIVDTSS